MKSDDAKTKTPVSSCAETARIGNGSPSVPSATSLTLEFFSLGVNMARIRSIKPEFFTDGKLGRLSPLHRLLFEGLWCHADREGRLEDFPEEIKIKVLPYDECDVNMMLDDLQKCGLIIRYKCKNKQYLAIPNFLKHQIPNAKEPASIFPSQKGLLTQMGEFPNERRRREIYEKANYLCSYCGLDLRNEPRRICLDHVIPLSQSGSNNDKNLVTSCKECNARKTNKTPEEADLKWPEGKGETVSYVRVNRPLTVGQPPDKHSQQGREGKGEEGKGEGEEGDSAASPPYVEIIADLNLNASTNFKSNAKSTKGWIRARWEEGFRLEDFKTVHRKKCAEWKGTKWAKYLCPETLYSNKFEKYLNQREEDTRFSDVTRHNLKVAQDWLDSQENQGEQNAGQ